MSSIQWGNWEYGGGNGMRVGVEVSRTSVSHESTYVLYTLRFYTQNQYRYNDPQRLDFYGGYIDGAESYTNTSGTNSSGGGAVYRGTRWYTHDYSEFSYGSSPGVRGFSATVWGAYNGISPSVTINERIPARPVGTPGTPFYLGADRVSDSITDLSWTNRSRAGRPYGRQEIRRRDNVTGSYHDVDMTVQPDATTHRDSGTVANRRYRYAIRAHNPAGYSSWEYAPYIQTSPATPWYASVEKSTPSSVIVRWTNRAGSAGYRFSTVIEESVNGGSWVEIDEAPSSRESYFRKGVAPGSTVRYRVRAKSTVGATTYSSYSTTDSIQLQQVPNVPTDVSIARVNDGHFELSWVNNPDGPLAPYQSLTVQRRIDSDDWWIMATLDETTTQLTDMGTEPNSRYEWRIRANNEAGSSAWVDFTTYQTKPSPPGNIVGKVIPGATIKVTWDNYVDYGTAGDFYYYIRHYQDGVLSDVGNNVPGLSTEYHLTQIDPASSYRFEVRAVSTVGYESDSGWISGVEFPASTVPLAPTLIWPNGDVFDAAKSAKFRWNHNPSQDGSDQTALELSISEDAGVTWSSGGKQSYSDEFWNYPANLIANGGSYSYRVRTWGVHADPSPWSAIGTATTSATPVIVINKPEPEAGVIKTSHLTVQWSYADVEGTPQAKWDIELLNGRRMTLEKRSGADATTSVSMDTVIQNGEQYILRLQVVDGDGLESGWQEVPLTADFIPPAVPTLTADYSQDNGTTVLTLTSTPDDGGVTTLPAIGVDLRRRMVDRATGAWGPWTTMMEGLPADTTLVDTTSGIAGDSEYQIVTHSDAPSAVTSDPLTPSGFDDRWVYLSGGPNFTQVCRLMGNVSIRTTASRDRALYHFAGRQKPVMYAGEARHRTIEVAGLLDGESSLPPEWEALVAECDVLLLRDPLGHRIYGSVPEVSIDRLGGDMYSVSFVMTEIDFP